MHYRETEQGAYPEAPLALTLCPAKLGRGGGRTSLRDLTSSCRIGPKSQHGNAIELLSNARKLNVVDCYPNQRRIAERSTTNGH